MANHRTPSVPLVILSSDKYSDVLVDLLIHIKKRVFLPMEIYYSVNSRESAQKVANIIDHQNACENDSSRHINLKPLYSGEEDWTATLRSAVITLLSLGYQKALFVLEDFFVTSVKHNLIVEASQIDADVVYVSYRPRAMCLIYACSSYSPSESGVHIKNILRVSPSYRYGISLQPAIWSLPKLLAYIDEARPTSPWDFERPYMRTAIKEIVRISQPAYLYQDQAIEKGRWFPLKAFMYRRYSRRSLVSPAYYIQVVFRTAAAKAFDAFANFIAKFRLEHRK